ncbi:unnamed protein product [Gongylonema pulchrum]|uniref:Cytochrome P450 n=1 Tax=Gongylonema pulchrum TaxID=637853 RepID=A0A183ECU3_9BILA|nr:unnamed protein product [Gongylonema pulchrum]
MRLPYLDAVFHEALRIYPPITFLVNRTCTKRCRIGDIDFYPGVQIGIPVWNIHHDPYIWPEPEHFKPERFYMRKDYDPMSWLPFGTGPRNCFGMRFATAEYKTTIARLLLQFKIVADPEVKLTLQDTLGMLQVPYIRVKLQKR